MASPIDNNRARLRRIYDNYRTAWMSRDYYACRLHYFRRCNQWYEIVLAVGASGSGLSGWYVWQTRAGVVVWAVIAGASALLAILKPILQIPKQVERYSKLYAGYCTLTYDYEKLVDEIKATGGLTPEMRELREKSEERFKALSEDDDPKPSEKLLRQCQEGVRRRVEKFDDWCPKPIA